MTQIAAIKGSRADGRNDAMQSDAIHPNAAVARRLAKIYRLNRKTIDLRLDSSPYQELLARLGNPHLKTPPIVHVAGTNGKGSTLAFLRSMLNECGYRTHVYTSPHLTHFNERIVLGDEYVSDDELIKALDEVEAVNGDNPVTFFEYTTALAFHLFARHADRADILLLEVGMGGRLDCTNVVATPICTAVTKIGMDHMAFLGDDIAKIAYEKACIMKRGAPCVIARQDHEQETQRVFAAKADELDIPLRAASILPPDTELGLAGTHQYENAGTAMAIADVLTARGFDMPHDKCLAGLAKAKWRGRLEAVTTGAFLSAVQNAFGADARLYFDGAHNEAAAYVLRDTLAQWRDEAPQRPIILMLGMGSDKDVNAFLDIVTDQIDGLYVLDLSGGMHPQSARDLFEKLSPAHQCRAHMWADRNAAPPSAQAQEKAQTQPQAAPTVLVCGSLFLYQMLMA